MRVRWTVGATRRLRQIESYLEERDPLAAARIVKSILQQSEQLGQFPAMGRAGRVVGTRELIVTGTPYLIGYLAGDRDVLILHVQHGAQLWPDGLSSLSGNEGATDA